MAAELVLIEAIAAFTHPSLQGCRVSIYQGVIRDILSDHRPRENVFGPLPSCAGGNPG